MTSSTPTEPTPAPATGSTRQTTLQGPAKRRRAKAPAPADAPGASIAPSTSSPKQPKKPKTPKIADQAESSEPTTSLPAQASQLAGPTDFSREQLMEALLADYAPPSLTTKQTTLRLEAKLLERLSKLCAKEHLSREVLIEALFEHYEQDRSAKKTILTQAKQKASQRQALANHKRAKTMLANLHRLSSETK